MTGTSTLKSPAVLTFAIVAVGALLAWHFQPRLTAARTANRQLAAAAASQGLTLAAPAGRSANRERVDPAAEARAVAADAIAYAVAWAAGKGNRNLAAELSVDPRFSNLGTRRTSLDVAQVRIFIAEVRAATDLTDAARESLVATAIRMLAGKYPEAALALCEEFAGQLSEPRSRAMIVTDALESWAALDLTAALAWFQQHSDSMPESLAADAKRNLVLGIMGQDSGRGLTLIGELGLAPGEFMNYLGWASKTPEQRGATLAALRDFVAAIPDEGARKQAAESGVKALTQTAAGQGAEAASEWVKRGQLTPEEVGIAADTIERLAQDQDAGQWIEWMGANLSSDQANKRIYNMVRFWTEQHHRAATAWLDGLPDSPLKNLSVRVFAETVAAYEPETAVQWAATLPPGGDRDASLRRIHQIWSKQDPVASAASAKAHGIE